MVRRARTAATAPPAPPGAPRASAPRGTSGAWWRRSGAGPIRPPRASAGDESPPPAAPRSKSRPRPRREGRPTSRSRGGGAPEDRRPDGPGAGRSPARGARSCSRPRARRAGGWPRGRGRRGGSGTCPSGGPRTARPTPRRAGAARPAPPGPARRRSHRPDGSPASPPCSSWWPWDEAGRPSRTGGAPIGPIAGRPRGGGWRNRTWARRPIGRSPQRTPAPAARERPGTRSGPASAALVGGRRNLRDDPSRPALRRQSVT